MKQQILKYLFLFWFGGSFYVTLEVFYRNRSHWTMFLLAGALFLIIGSLNEKINWFDGIVFQITLGTFIATFLEFLTGIVVNIWLKWNIWDYSHMWGNVLGQICPLFTLLWMPIIFIAIVVDDVIRWKFFDEEKPCYTWF